jgi:hypothetical protein
MALTAAVQPNRARTDEVEPIPDSIPRHGRDGRPKIRHADDPTVMSFYRRPSSFGEGIESTFALDRRADRLVIAGMVRFPELADEIAAGLYVNGEEPTDWDGFLVDPAVKAELHRIRDLLLTRMGAERRAALGTELHGYRHRLDRGETLPFLGPQMWAALEAWSAMALRFTWHGSEQFVVCDRWRTAGTYDALWSPKAPLTPPYGPMVTPSDRVVVDLKSGEWVLKYGEIGRCIQLTQYPNGVPYVHRTDEEVAAGLAAGLNPHGVGRLQWPDGVVPRTDWALIPHVPLEHPEDSGLLWVDLTKGAQLSDVAVQVHEARRLVGELFYPCELPVEEAPPAAPALVKLIEGAQTPGELGTLFERFGNVWMAEHSAAAHARFVTLTGR